MPRFDPTNIDPATWRRDLGLGTAATQASSAFDAAGAASAAQTAILAERDWTVPTGALAQTIPRETFINTDLLVLTDGRLYLTAIYLRAGQVITSISFISGGTPLGTGTNQWFSLYSAALAKLKVTSDDTSTAWAANTVKTLNLASGTYTVPTSGLYYLGIVVKASQLPSFRGMNHSSGVAGLAPIIQGNSTSSLTDPASAPSTAAAITATASRIYGYVS